MQILKYINIILAVLFSLCYAYQIFYIPVPWLLGRRKNKRPAAAHDIAVLICARNESAVIGDLIACLKHQTYPQEKLHIFVMADNCTDDTAWVAEEAGAIVYSRFDRIHVGKGYALEALLNHIKLDYADGFDAYLVFDADNLLEQDYVEQMNRTFSEGYDIITSYRNSKNYGTNWISAGYSLWFMRESRYLNHARSLLGCSCAVSGTGFMFSRAVAESIKGWPFHMLTEDIEFSIDQITSGMKIGFCPDAVLYDEQPVTFAQSWRQRLRWAKGYLQVFAGYHRALFRGIGRGDFSCFDMTMNIMPAVIFSITSIGCNIALGILGAIKGEDIMIAVSSFAGLAKSLYLTLFFIGVITTITEWRKIRTTPVKKIFYTITFPLFMLTYIPISIAAFFCRVEWRPIEHGVTAAEFACVDRCVDRDGSF